MPDRILVYGVTGSGKTWLAERISVATGIPWHSRQVEQLAERPLRLRELLEPVGHTGP